jgi:hypothetical protein
VCLICPKYIKQNDVLFMGVKCEPLRRLKDVNDKNVKIKFSGKYVIFVFGNM